MRHFGPTSTLAVACIVFSVSYRDAALAFSSDAPSPPSVEFGELYGAVQMSGLFSDQKTFADAIPDKPPSQIVADYEKQKQLPGFDLKAFVALHFATPKEHFEIYERRPNRSVSDYISDMWQVLRREPDEIEPYSSLLPLSRPYIVPGGRFREIYYWDSYFTMLGLEQDGQHALARDMLQNFASLIDRYGHVPNGNRSYYLSRSQPPFFSSMVELIATRDGDRLFVDYLPELQAEYDYWMEGAENLALVRLTGMHLGFRMALCSIAIGMIAPPLATNPIVRTSRLRTGDPDRPRKSMRICAPEAIRMGLHFALACRRQGSLAGFAPPPSPRSISIR